MFALQIPWYMDIIVLPWCVLRIPKQCRPKPYRNNIRLIQLIALTEPYTYACDGHRINVRCKCAFIASFCTSFLSPMKYSRIRTAHTITISSMHNQCNSIIFRHVVDKLVNTEDIQNGMFVNGWRNSWLMYISIHYIYILYCHVFFGVHCTAHIIILWQVRNIARRAFVAHQTILCWPHQQEIVYYVLYAIDVIKRIPTASSNSFIIDPINFCFVLLCEEW